MSPSVEWIESPTIADLRPVIGMLNHWYAEVIPGDRPAPVEELYAVISQAPAYQRSYLAVVEEGNELVGATLLVAEDLEGRRNDAYLDFLLVSPHSRRQRIAGRLVDAAVARAREAGRSRLTGSSAAGDATAEAFARRYHAELELVEKQNRASTADLDAGLLREWVGRAAERAGDYSLIRVDGLLPDDLRPAFAALTSVMNTAPHGPNLEDLILSADDVDELQRTYEAQGYTRWTVIARHEPSGELAGFTELMISPFRPWMAFQWDTGVDPRHRNLGLGRWMKAANALRVLEECPEVEEIETWNASSNASMLAINLAMGFRTVAEWNSWELPV